MSVYHIKIIKKISGYKLLDSLLILIGKHLDSCRVTFQLQCHGIDVRLQSEINETADVFIALVASGNENKIRGKESQSLAS